MRPVCACKHAGLALWRAPTLLSLLLLSLLLYEEQLWVAT